MAGKSKGPTLVHDPNLTRNGNHPPVCCTHNAAQPYVVVPPGAMGPGTGPVLGQLKTCCWCGPLRVHFVGVLEPGHGPWVTYDPSAVQVEQQPRIVVPR